MPHYVYFRSGTGQNIALFARLVEPGDHYGTDGCFLHLEAEPMVEFYDRRYDHNPWLGRTGQFISRYTLATFMAAKDGINLDGGSPEWQISSTSCAFVQESITHYLEQSQ